MQSCSFCGHVDRSKPRKLCRPSLNADCCSICRKLDHLNAEIARGKAFLQGLLDQRDGLRAELNRAHPSIIHRLPPEVASIIFTIYASDVSGRHLPFTLGAVCQRWREIAWSTPSVWQTLDICFSPKEISRTRLQLMEGWLNRSGRLPLSITLIGYRLDSEFYRFHRLIDIINRYCNQWYSLDLTLPSSLLARFDDSTCVSFPMYKLSLRSSIDDHPIDTLSRVAPQVVEIYGLSCGHLSLNWTGITDITCIRLPNVGEALQILRLCPSLRKCKFGFSRNGVQLPYAAGFHITHAMLESLDIAPCGVSFLEYFFKSTTFPVLKHLRFLPPYNYVETDEFISFLTRSSTVLKSLVIEDWDLTGEELTRIARSVPSLESLQIAYGSSANKDGHDLFYHALASHIPTKNNPIPSSTEPLLPSLQTFGWFGFKTFPWEVVPGFFAPLSKNGSTRRRPLTTIHICCCRHENDAISYIDKEVLSQLSEFTDHVQFQFKDFISGKVDRDLWKMSLKRSGEEEEDEEDEDEDDDLEEENDDDLEEEEDDDMEEEEDVDLEEEDLEEEEDVDLGEEEEGNDLEEEEG